MSNGINEEFLRELKAKCDLIDIVQSYIPVQKRGGRYACVCPFHADKNPSMYLNQSDGYYHCFGCGAAGDVIKFVQQMESVDFMDAIKILAEKANMPLPEFKLDPQYEKKKERHEVLRQLMRDAAIYYRNNLLDEKKGKEAREYFASRNINDDTCRRYGLGVSLDSDSLIKYLLLKNYKKADILECGLIPAIDKPYDAFANRVIVPIIDSMSNVVAFGGRYFHGEEKEGMGAKYKNSTNTTLFNKGTIVYGINFIKRDKKTEGLAKDLILVEGYMDVIALGAAGIKNVVAGMGTALTEGQIREIRKINQNLYVCYDGDEAGKKATLRNIDMLNQAGLNIRIMSLDEGKDPDETIKENGVEYFLKKKEEALPIYEYKLKLCREAYDLRAIEGRRKYLAAALDVLKSIPDEAQRDVYAEVVSKDGGVSVESIKESIIKGTEPKQVKLTVPQDADASLLRAARYSLFCLMTNVQCADISQFKAEWFSNPTHIKIIEYAFTRPRGNFELGMMFDQINTDNEISEILKLESLCFQSFTKQKEYYMDCLCKIANEYLTKKIEGLNAQILKETDATHRRELSQEVMILQKKKHSKSIEDKI